MKPPDNMSNEIFFLVIMFSRLRQHDRTGYQEGLQDERICNKRSPQVT